MKSVFSIVVVLFLCCSTTSIADRPTEAETETRRVRLQAHADTFADWVDRVCDLSDEERLSLHKLQKEELDRKQRRWLGRLGAQPNKYFDDYSPLYFTGSSGAARAVTVRDLDSSLPELLTARNQARLAAAVQEREDAISLASITYLVDLVDSELYLTQEQTEQVTAIFAAEANIWSSWVHDADAGHLLRLAQRETGPAEWKKVLPVSNGIVQLPVRVIHRETGGKFLSQTQVEVAQEVMAADPRKLTGGLFFLPVVVDREEWAAQIDSEVNNLKQQFEQAVARRAEVLAEFLSLTDEQERHLVVAGKGAMLEILGEWKQRTIREVDAIARKIAKAGGVRQEFHHRNDFPHVNLVFVSDLWRRAVDAVQYADPNHSRIESSRAALVGHITTIFDRELWLTPDQRGSFRRLVSAALPDSTQMNRRSVSPATIRLRPLFRIPDEAIAILLTEPQQTAWRTLRDQFDQDGDQVSLRLATGDRIEIAVSP